MCIIIRVLNSRRLQPTENENRFSALAKSIFFADFVSKKEVWLKPLMLLIEPPAEAGGYSTDNYNVGYLF